MAKTAVVKPYKSVIPADQTEWLALKKQTVGGSEVAALFGASPWLTYFQLWHLKNGTMPDIEVIGEHVELGNSLEAAIANHIANRNDFKIRHAEEYIYHPTVEGMGASLDYVILDDKGADSEALEIKNVINASKWDIENNEAPVNYELQLQHQLACRPDLKAGRFGALFYGKETHILKRDRNPGAIQLIEDKVGAFWESIKAGNEPEPTTAADLAIVQAIYKNPTKGKIITNVDQTVVEILKGIDQLSEEIKIRKEKSDALKATILFLMKDAEELKAADGYGMTAKTVNKKEYTVRASSSRQMRLKTPKGDE